MFTFIYDIDALTHICHVNPHCEFTFQYDIDVVLKIGLPSII